MPAAAQTPVERAPLAAMGFDIVATYSAAAATVPHDLLDFRTEIESQHDVRCRLHRLDLETLDTAAAQSVFDACPSAVFGLGNNAAIFEWDDLGTLERVAVMPTTRALDFAFSDAPAAP
jgi:hypothetical protein